jgi:hypothetical protein
MFDTELLSSVAKQMMEGETVEVSGKRISVCRTSAQRFRSVSFEIDGRNMKPLSRTRKSLERCSSDQNTDSHESAHDGQEWKILEYPMAGIA